MPDGWVFDEGAGRWQVRMGRRVCSIGWDEDDSTFFLSVVVEPPPNVEGERRSYAAPLCLLAALLLLPRSEHPRLLERVRAALIEVRDAGVLARVHEVVALSLEVWPKTAVAAQSLGLAGEAMPTLERLSLDIAAAGAWD